MIYTILQDRELMGNSSNWANWMSKLTLTTCLYCAKQHGKIASITILDTQYEVNAHLNCKCMYVPMRTKKAGTSTDLGNNGADVYLVTFQRLPNYYVLKETAEDAGWVNWRGNLDQVLPGKMIGGNVYQNRDGKLPMTGGRVWYEADINYDGGYRSNDRIIYSNDGLIFVTYDHYKTFYEVTR